MIRAKIEVPAGSKALALGLLLATLMALSLMLAAKPAQAKDFTVTNALDAGAGSLRQAIEDANASPGADTIKFNIPVQAVHTLRPASALPVIREAVTIDGYSQPGSRPNSLKTGGTDAVILVELNGLHAGSRPGLDISASNVVVRGLAINHFPASGIGTFRANGVRIEGNFIGTDASGTLDRGNDEGVNISLGGKNTVGGTTSGQRNLISGNNGDGVELGGSGTNKVQGNLIGVQKDGSTIIGGSDVGVNIFTPRNIIGGAEPGAANTIAFNREEGVLIDEDATAVGNRILSNSIFENRALSIDLRGDGRTLNDPKDPDKGENNFQNFPVLSSAGSVGDGKITIEGTLDSTPSTKKKKKSFNIQFFSSPQGEDAGKTFLGQKRVTTNKQGKASFTFESAQPVPDRDEITATATGPGGNTSEFSDPETFFID